MTDENDKKPHPLSETLDMNPDNIDEDEEFKNRTDIPEEAELNDVIKLALKVYRELMDDIEYIAPKNRVKHLEVAERYLNQAKDAMYKKEQILLSREKFEASKKGKDSDKDTSNDNGEEEKKFDRKSLLAEVSKEKRG